MKALLIDHTTIISPSSEPLRLADVPVPEPGAGEVRLRVQCCGICHTELDEIEGRTPPSSFPRIPGHQVVGIVEKLGEGVDPSWLGVKAGVAWIFSSCGTCSHCFQGDDNLCADFRATGRDVDGGYAEFMTVPADYIHPLPDSIDSLHAAPLLCAGAIGYRSLRLCNLHNGEPLGLTGFGGSNHLVMQLVRALYPDSPVYVFARDPGERKFALSLGARWAGTPDEAPPQKLAAIIDTTPVWHTFLQALRHLQPGGRLVINAIRKESSDAAELQQLDYPSQLWMEKEIKSVANVARRDVWEFLEIAAKENIVPEIQCYQPEQINFALRELRAGGIRGAKVLVMDPSILAEANSPK